MQGYKPAKGLSSIMSGSRENGQASDQLAQGAFQALKRPLCDKLTGSCHYTVCCTGDAMESHLEGGRGISQPWKRDFDPHRGMLHCECWSGTGWQSVLLGADSADGWMRTESADLET